MQAQWEQEDREMEQMVREAQMRAEEERRREEQRRIGEQKWLAEEAERQQRLAELQKVAREPQVVPEDDEEEDNEDGDRQGVGPSVPKKRKYDDKVSSNGNRQKRQKINNLIIRWKIAEWKSSPPASSVRTQGGLFTGKRRGLGAGDAPSGK